MIVYFDCSNGVAGDMIVAALLDAGAPWPQLQSALAALHVHGYSLSLADVTRAGIRAKHFKVALDDHHHHHRNLAAILDIINAAALPDPVKTNAGKVFSRLAEAEAKVHGCPVADVHFHEVGAVDAIVDIVGACLCLDFLKAETILYSTVAVGSGQIKAAHGTLPVPAPATAELLTGRQIAAGNRTGELATPTGAAILTALGTQEIHLPELQLHAVGYGAGTRDDPAHPNVLRVLAGRRETQKAETDEIAVLHFNVDDITAEHLGWLADQLFAQGALDVVQIPAFMKKNRAATVVQVLAPVAKESDLADFILTQSTSFGLRMTRENRRKLAREFLVVVLPEGKVRVKLGYHAGKLVQIAPEFDDCRKIAERSGRNFRQLYAQAAELARQELTKPSDSH